MVFIFIEQINERLLYTFNFVFKDYNIDYKLTNDDLLFEKNTTEIKLNYSKRKFKNTYQIVPSSLLFEDDIKFQEINLVEFNEEKCFSFFEICDPFASIFYVLTRMEEYLEIRKDHHNRFESKYSIQKKYDLLDKVVCDRWSIAIHKGLEKYYQKSLNASKPKFTITPTFDIDNTFAFKWYAGIRQFISHTKDLLQRDHQRVQFRKDVLKGKLKDPYDTFKYILDIKKRGFNPILFWHVGDFGKYDKNISFYNPKHVSLVRKLSDYVKIGIHPSYKSNTSTQIASREIERLNRALDTPVSISRQHYLMLNLPFTYQKLIRLGIEHDYTMGFADEVGFRAGTCRPFYFFDLTKNESTTLLIHPFAYMDGTLNEYKKYSIEESKIIVLRLIQEVKNYGGDFICIWHNSTIGNYGKWKDWQFVLEFTLGFKKGEKLS